MNRSQDQRVLTPNVTSAYRRFILLRQTPQSILGEWESPEVNSFKRTKSPYKILSFVFGFLCTLIYALYLSAQLFVQYGKERNAIKEPGSAAVDTIWTFLWGIYYWWAVVNYVNVMLKQEDSIAFWKTMENLDKQMPGSAQLKLLNSNLI